MVMLALIFLPNLVVKILHAHKSGFALKIFLNSGTMNDHERGVKYFTAWKRLKIRSNSYVVTSGGGRWFLSVSNSGLLESAI